MDTNDLSEVAKLVVKEEIILEKFEGTPEDGELVERIFLTDGAITKHQYFEHGKMVKEEEKEGIN